MAKRRLNKKFLILLSVGALAFAALGVGALVLRNRFLAQHPEEYLAAGRAALAKKDYAGARDNLLRAAQLSHPDAPLDVMIGDALNGLSGKDPDNVLAARGMWEQALTVDPKYMPAMERLIEYWRDELELHARPGERAQQADQLETAGKRLQAADPDNHLANVTCAEALLETMLDGIQVSPEDAKAAEGTLLNLEADDPADAEIPYYVARAYIYGQETARPDEAARAATFFDRANKVMADAVKNQPENASLHYRYGKLLLQIAAQEISDAQSTSGNDGSAAEAPATRDLIARAVGQVDLARQLVRPDDPQYVDISLYDARLTLERPASAPNAPMAGTAASTTAPAPENGTAQDSAAGSAGGANNEPARARIAESIYRDVLKHYPNDPATRIALAQLLGNLHGRRDEAIAMLSEPLVNDHPIPGIKGTLLPLFQNQANIHLLSLEIDSVESTKDPQQRQALLASADALCDRVYQKSPDSATVGGLKGRLQLMHNHVVEATQTLKKALALTDPDDPTQQRSRYELKFSLARACEIAQQTGDAKKLASEIVSAYGRFVPARMMLARLLITEHDFAGAKPQIDFLESILPTNPELTTAVLRMRIATLDPVHDADRIKAYFNRLPEGTRDEKMDKAALARLAKLDDQAVRLETLVHTAAPGDVEAASLLAQWYQSQGQNQKAIDVLNEALAVNPSDSALLAYQMQLQGRTSAQVDSTQPLTPQVAAGAPDAFSSEVAQLEVARSRGDMTAVDSHLAAAEKLRPNDPRIWDAIFMRSLETANWDRASVYLEKLAAINEDHAGGLIYRFSYALARSDLQKANEIALQLTREKPEFSVSWSKLGQVQEAAGNYEDAISNFQQALDRQTQNLDAVRGIVDCSYALGNIEQAKRYIDLGRRVAPANESFKELALSYEMTYGDPQNVIMPRLEALKSAPDDQQTWLNLAATYVAAAEARTKAQDAAGAADDYQRARLTLSQAIAKFPDTPRFVAAFAKLALDHGDFPAAEQANLDFAARPSQKGRPQTAVMLSDFYELAGKPEQSVKVLNDYLAAPFQPSNHVADVGVELHLSSLLADRLNRFDDALAVLGKNSQDPSVIRQRVALLINAGRLKEAQKTLEDLADAAPLSPDLLLLKGVAALDENQPIEAKQCFDQVIAAQPNNAEALNQRAQTMLRGEHPNYGAAIADLNKARDLKPQDMEIRLLIAQVDNQRNQPDDAIRELESAIRVSPANKRVRLKLIDLYVASKPPRWTDAQRTLHETTHIPSLADDADFIHVEAHMDLVRAEYVQAEKLIHTAMEKAPGNLSMVHTYYDILLKTNACDELLSESAQLLADHQNAPTLWWVHAYRAAEQELEEALAATAAVHDLPGTAQVIQNYARLVGADAAIKVAAARAPQDPHWYLLAANLCQQKSDPDGAVTWLETALSHFEQLSAADQNDVLHMAAAEYLAKSPPDTLKSADMYRRIIKRSPDDIDSLNNLACILVDDPKDPAFQPREALDHSEKAYNTMVHAGQDEPLIKDTYGWTLIVNGNNDQGLALIHDALGKQDFPEGHYHLAEGLLKQQPPNSEVAASELAKAMQMIDQDERDGKPIDEVLKSRVQEEQKRVQSGLAG